jgi:hypothetical protein
MGVTVPAGGTFPSVSCGTLNDCEIGLWDSPNNFVTLLATLSCSGTCVAQFPETMSTTVSLAGQHGISRGDALVDITITNLQYAVSTNTTDVDLLGFTLYMAPSGVTKPTDLQAIAFGTLPPIPAGTDTQGGQVQLMPNSVETFEMFTRNVSIPFDLIAAATVNVPAGSVVGRLTVTVSGTISAYATPNP